MWPHISPILVRIGPFAIHYYALAYITALLIGWRLVRRMCALEPVAATGELIDDFLTWATLGVILGGRLGYVLFYQPIFFFAHPSRIVAVWDGGMSFHGGFLGVTIAIIWFSVKHHINILRFADRIAVAVPLGLCLGRIANFINGELWGRPAARWFPFPMIYPQSGSMVPRYPSELIEATLEGIILFAVMLIAARSLKLRHFSGMIAGIFVVGYGGCRIISECFRAPDSFLGFLPFGATMGQILSLPMIFIGLGLIGFSITRRRDYQTGETASEPSPF
jgi:phosphatidylglycerol:prolipoprotein diacylglycerol transferase